MSDKQKKILATVALSILIIAVAAISLLTVFKLQQIGTDSVAPTAPSQSSAYVPQTCQLTFIVDALACYVGECTSDTQCGTEGSTNLKCQEVTTDAGTIKTCVNPSCPTDSDCECNVVEPLCQQNTCTINTDGTDNCPTDLVCDETSLLCVNSECPGDVNCVCDLACYKYTCDTANDQCPDDLECQTVAADIIRVGCLTLIISTTTGITCISFFTAETIFFRCTLRVNTKIVVINSLAF